MSIEVSCDRCGRRYAVKDAQAGKRGKCLYCGAVVIVPGRRTEPRKEESLEKLPGSSVADLLNEELPAESTPALPARTVLEKRTSSQPNPLSQSGLTTVGRGLADWLCNHKLQSAVAVMGVLFFFLYGMAGAYRSMAALVLIGAGIFLIGFLRRVPEVEELFAQILGYGLSGLIALYTIYLLARCMHRAANVPDGYNRYFTPAAIDWVVTAILAVGLIGTTCFLFHRFGFFRVLAWWYVCVVGVLPLAFQFIMSLPDAQQEGGLLARAGMRIGGDDIAPPPGHDATAGKTDAQSPPRSRTSLEPRAIRTKTGADPLTAPTSPVSSKTAVADSTVVKPKPDAGVDKIEMPPRTRTGPAVKQPAPPDNAGPLDAKYEKAVRDYVRRTYADLLIAEPAALRERLRWFPAGNRAVVGLRWGLGVYWAEQLSQPAVRTLDDLRRQTGAVGIEFGFGLQKRTEEGKFGVWPPPDDPRYAKVTLVGGGKPADLLAAAQRQGLDVLAVFVFGSQRAGKNAIPVFRVRFYDLASQQPLWSSEPISLAHVAAAGRQAVDFLATLFRKVDEDYCLLPMPAREPEWIKTRLKSLTAGLSTSENPLPRLCEIRCYEGQRLLKSDETAPWYDAVLGSGKGGVLSAGAIEQRRQVVEEWLKK